ncbi:MAG: GGDEF domain-containing protein [Myxococcales bacterium]|nr:GGDEF domain-containing protein [Myxococcales bacterium]
MTGIALCLSPLAASFDRTAGFALTAGFAVLTASLVGLRGRTPAWLYPLYLGYAVLAITLANVAFAGASMPLLPYYFWCVVYAACFLRVPHVVVHLLSVAVGVGASLYLGDVGDERSVRWGMHVAALALVGAVVYRLRAEVDLLVGRLHGQATTDSLTGVGNRRSFDRALGDEIDVARTRRSPLALVIGDLDRFKVINDQHGHVVGDAVLRRVAGVLHERVCAAGAVFRVGGEEFAILLPGADEAAARTVAETVRGAVEASVANAEHVKVTVSFGVTVLPASAGSTDDVALAMYAAADQALYDAKHAGRNRVMSTGKFHAVQSKTLEPSSTT